LLITEFRTEDGALSGVPGQGDEDPKAEGF